MSDQRAILVTGAGGFIGGRMVEVFHSLGAGTVKAGLRRWSSAARVGRFPVELVKCDITDPKEARAALEGVTHLLHCAVGDRRTTVDGTRTLLNAALAAGVKRVVHLSTIDVYGTPEGEVDETHPIRITGRPYGDMKIEAENAVKEVVDRGLHVTILRPTLVHGPFSTTWTMAYATRLLSPPWLVSEADSQGTCNLVYVDDLAGAVLAAWKANTPSGEAYNINGPERPTWNRYFHALNDAMGLPPLVPEQPGRARLSAKLVHPLRKSAKFALKHFQDQIMGAYKSSEMVRKVMKRAEGIIRTTPAPEEFTVYSRKVSYGTRKAETGLGYRPRFPLSDAMPLTGAWLKQNGFGNAGSTG